jgi:hypothetical protein
MAATLLWRGLDAFRAEIARVETADGGLVAKGTQIGLGSEPYELRYQLEPRRLHAQVADGPSLELDLEGRDAFDLGFSPLFNSIPVLAHALHRGGEGRDFVMAWVSVPDLTVRPSEQRYEPLGEGLVRFTSESFIADLELDRDGFVVRYPGLAERVS